MYHIPTKNNYSLYNSRNATLKLNLKIYVCVCVCVYVYMGFPGGTSGKEPACQCRR